MVLVTGGAGYIGSHTTLSLLEKGHQVVVLDNLSNSNPEALRRIQEIPGKPVQFRKADLLDRRALDAVLAEYTFDAVT
jgi:UDP-glucose 4-epimerase